MCSGQLPLLILPAEEVLWSNDKIGRALYVTCDRRYDPIAQKGGGQWQDNKLARALMEDPTSVRELFYRLKDHWYYYGTYRVPDGHSSVPIKPVNSSNLWVDPRLNVLISAELILSGCAQCD